MVWRTKGCLVGLMGLCTSFGFAAESPARTATSFAKNRQQSSAVAEKAPQSKSGIATNAVAGATQHQTGPVATAKPVRPAGMPSLTANTGGESQRGNFRGDPCADATWNNGFYNGINGYTSENAESAGWIVSWTADDVDLPGGNIELVYWYSLDSYADGGADGEMVLVDSDGSAPVDGTEVVEGGGLDREDTGDNLFGYQVYLNGMSLNMTVAANTYYAGFRPIFNDFGRSFIATADLTGTDSFIKSDFFGYPNWTAWVNLVGSESNVAFCIFVNESGEPTGACCSNGDCVRVTAAECKELGGDYQGDGTNCRPNKCPGAPGACCFENGTCEVVKVGECEDRGGDFQGEGVRCTAGLCPLPDVCADSLYNNIAYDGFNGLSSEDVGSQGWIVSWTADDFKFDERVTITDLHWITLDSSGLNPTGADYNIWYAQPNCAGPAKKDLPIVSADNVPYTRVTDGSTLFGYTVYQNSLDPIGPHVLVPGQYFVGIRPQYDAFLRSFWATAPLVGCQAFFQGDIFGYPNFVPWSSQLGVETDVAFCITGFFGGDPIGACCLNGTCEILSKEDCGNRGGDYQGDDITCYPNPCPGAPGACCLETGECFFGTPTECEERGGKFQGGDIECLPGLCPIPDPCDGSQGEVLYNNSQYDGVNGYTSENGEAIGWLVSWTADDVNFERPVFIQDFHWYTLDSPNFATDGTADYLVVDGDGSCLPVDDNAGGNVPYLRLLTGDTLFGYNVAQNNIGKDAGVSVFLAPGQYWIGLRPVLTDFVRSFWATAPLTNCDAVIKSSSFGYPNWTPWSQLVGSESDVAFCLTGEYGTGDFGACCNSDGTCKVRSPDNCREVGGEYLGNDTTCRPNPCPDAPGACCLETGQCVFMQESKCKEAGGDFQGVDVRCTGGLCPIPDFCGGAFGDVLYNNSVYNEVSALWNVWNEDGSGFIDAECADDIFNPYTSFDMEAIHYYQIATNGFQYTDQGSLSIYAADGPSGIPGTNLVDLHNLPEFRVDTGNLLFGFYPIYLHNLMGLSESLSGGTYWICGRPQTPAYTGQVTYCMSANVVGEQGYFRSPYFTNNDWVPSSSQFGSPQDFALCIVGKITGEVTGKCCLDGDCLQITEADCKAKGGSFGGNLTDCVPNDCPGAPGACCVGDNECESLKPGDCESKGGEFKGSGTICTGLTCLVSACTSPDNIYNNGAWDGLNGYFACRWDAGGYDSVTASDITLSADTKITQVSFLTLDYQASVSGADVIYLPNSGCTPDEGSEVWAFDQAYERFDTGELAFNFYNIYIYNVTVDIDLSAGDWYVGARPVFDNYTGPSYNATATIIDCQDVWRAVEFGQTFFTTLGYDFAICLAAEANNPCEGVKCGDSNGDGDVNFDDIDCFVAALIGPDNWADCGTELPGSAYVCANDTNGDKSVDFDDIDGFVFAIINGECP